MRHYQIAPEGNYFTLTAEAIPPEPAPGGYSIGLRMVYLSEAEAHRAGVFLRMNESMPIPELYQAAERHIGREPYADYGALTIKGDLLTT